MSARARRGQQSRMRDEQNESDKKQSTHFEVRERVSHMLALSHAEWRQGIRGVDDKNSRGKRL